MAEKNEAGYQRASYSIFSETMKVLDLTGPQLGEAIGYSRTAWNRWSKDGEIPQAAALACECLRRRQGPSARDLPQSWVLVVRGGTSHEKLAVEGVVKALNLTVKEV